MEVGSGMVEIFKTFTYLGSNLSSDCEGTCQVKCQIAKASKAFGALRIPIFLIVNYLFIIRELFMMLWSFPSGCMLLKRGPLCAYASYFS